MRFIELALALAMGFFCLTALAKSPANFNLDHEHVPGQLLVKFKGEIPKEWQGNIARTLPVHGFGIQSNEKTTLLKFYGIRASTQGLRDIALKLAALPNVESVEANVIYRLAEVPNDPEYSKLYGLKNTTNTNKDIDAETAWSISTGSKDILVGVIDTGIDYTHPDIADNYWNNPGEIGVDADGNDKATNGIDDDGNGYVDDFQGWDFINGDNDPMDDHSHGTHCAGTIGAVGNNGIGVVGVNWEVSLVGLKVFNSSGSTTTEALTEAINYATTIGVDLTSNSWGGGAESEVLRTAIEDADKAGILFVAAAGNSSSDNDAYPHYPSSYEVSNIIAVASTDSNDNLSSFSNYGAETVDVAAPGSQIYSTIPGGGYGYKSGTSMATPHVAGLVALVKSVFSDLDHLGLKSRILSTATPLDSLSSKVSFGRINASAGLEIDEIAPSMPTNLSIVGAGLTSFSLSWDISGDDGSEGSASNYEIRISSANIDEANWSGAEKVSLTAMDIRNGKVSAAIRDLSFNYVGYAAVKAIDNVGNRSTVSPSIPVALPQPVVYETNPGTTDTFAEIDDPWGVEMVDNNSLISDSPNGAYTNNLETSITTMEYEAKSGLLLAIKMKYDIETSYDNGHIEISTDGSDWQLVKKLTGNKDWHDLNLDLGQYLEASTNFKLRFRLKTDGSVTKDGWFIDDFRLIGPKVD